MSAINSAAEEGDNHHHPFTTSKINTAAEERDTCHSEPKEGDKIF